MSTFNNPPFFEGEQLASATINAKAGTNLQNAVNDLDESSIERHALDAQHLPALSMSDIFSNGFEATSPPTDPLAIAGGEYQNTLPLSGGGGTTYPYSYQTFDTTAGGGAISTYGPSDYGTNAPAHIGDGWRIPTDPNNSPAFPAQVTLASATNFDTSKIRGVLCRGSVEPIYSTGFSLAAANLRNDYIAALAMGIGWEDGAGTKHVVERSVRFFTIEAVRPGNAETMAFLTQDDLDSLGGDGTCAKIFLVVATAHPGDSTWLPNTPGLAFNNNFLYIRYHNLSTTPIHAGDL